VSALPNPQEVARFRDLVAARLGLDVDESRLGNLMQLLHHHVEARSGNCAAYLDGLAGGRESQRDLQALAHDLTVTETFFFRSVDQFAALTSSVLPDRLAALEGSRAIRMLSAGCASGEEPYSLAVAVRVAFPDHADSVAISAFDINPAMLERAARGSYSTWSLRETSHVLRARWFKREGPVFSIDPGIRRAVDFHCRNLAEDDAEFWRAGQFDIVFCRNVLMYFTPSQAQAAVARMSHALVPGGYLFLGYAETLRGLSNDFHLCHTDDSFYYRRKTDLSEEALPPAPPPQRIAYSLAPVVGDANWVDVIQRSTTRIHELVPATPVPTTATLPAPDLSGVLDHLQQERFDQALDQIGALPAAQANDPDVLLLKAVSLAHSTALDAAQAVCQELLERDALNAGAHYVLALCREGAGDLRGAVEHNQRAVYLDSQFAMPHLHLGLLAKRRGDQDVAARELQRAMVLLQNEDPARVLLFGGGFRREALVALCRAECASTGAALAPSVLRC